MRKLIYKDEVLDALQTCLDTEVIPYDKGKNYIRYEQAVYEINKLKDKSELFGNSEQMDGEYDPKPDIYYLAEKIGIHRLYALVVQLRGEPDPCIDTIGRQAAIDALNKLDVSDGVGISSVACDLQEEAISSIKNLPSAQQEIIRCKECVYADENYHCDYMTTWNDGDCFCCYGKRRTDGSD